MSLYNAFLQYLSDAAPGGALNPEVTPSGVLDAAALSSTPVPILGDILGLAADANMYINEPEERTLGNALLTGAGLLPFMVGASSIKAMDEVDLANLSPEELDEYLKFLSQEAEKIKSQEIDITELPDILGFLDDPDQVNLSPQLPLEAVTAPEYREISKNLKEFMPDEVKGAHRIRGGSHFKHPEYNNPLLTEEKALETLRAVGRNEFTSVGNISEYAKLKNVRESLPPELWDSLLKQTQLDFSKPAYIGRTEGVFSENYVNPRTYNTNPAKAGNIVSAKLLDMEKMDPRTSRDPEWWQNNLMSMYEEMRAPTFIYRVDPGESRLMSALNLADTDEILVQRGDLGKAIKSKKAMPLDEYLALLNEGAAPFAIGGVGIGALMSLANSEQDQNNAL